MQPQSYDRAQPDSRFFPRRPHKHATDTTACHRSATRRFPDYNPPTVRKASPQPLAGHPSQPDHPALNPARKHVSDAALRITVPAPADRRPDIPIRPRPRFRRSHLSDAAHARTRIRRQTTRHSFSARSDSRADADRYSGHSHRLSTAADPTFLLRPQRFRLRDANRYSVRSHRLSTAADPTFPLRPQRFPGRRRPVFRPLPQIEHSRRPDIPLRPQRFPAAQRRPVFRPPHRLSTAAEPTFHIRHQPFPAARRRPVFRPLPQIEHSRRPDIPFRPQRFPGRRQPVFRPPPQIEHRANPTFLLRPQRFRLRDADRYSVRLHRLSTASEPTFLFARSDSDGSAFSAPVWCSQPLDCTSRRPTAKKKGAAEAAPEYRHTQR